MDHGTALLERTFYVDLLSLVWIFVGLGVVLVLMHHFYRGLNTEGEGPPRVPAAPPSPRTRWLMIVVLAWWMIDSIYHARARIILPQVWHLELAQARTSLMPWLLPATHLWAMNPTLWDFGILAVDATLMMGLVMAFRNPRRSVLWAAVVWGLVRWALAGGMMSLEAHTVVGPGASLMAACAGLWLLYPKRGRWFLAGLALWLALDALASHNGTAAQALMLAVGFGGLALALWRDWTPLTLRILAGALAVQALLNMGRPQVSSSVGLWAPFLFVLVVGLHISDRAPAHQQRLGG